MKLTSKIILLIGFLITLSCSKEKQEHSSDSSIESLESSVNKESKIKENGKASKNISTKEFENLSWEEKQEKLKEAWNDMGEQMGKENVGDYMTHEMKDSAEYFSKLSEKIKESQERQRAKEERRKRLEEKRNTPENLARLERKRIKDSLSINKQITNDVFDELLNQTLEGYDNLYAAMGETDSFSEIFHKTIQEKLANLDAARLDQEMMTATEEIMLESAKMKEKQMSKLSDLEQLQIDKKEFDVEKELKKGTITAEFATAYKTQQRAHKKKFRDRKNAAQRAKQEFVSKNKNLYFGDSAEETYFDEKNKAVYLPLGSLSFADEVVDFYHPKREKNQKDLLQEPDYIKSNNENDNNIYSLGLEGSVTIQFTDNALVDVNGPDLYIFEIGKIEPTKLSISKDNKEWIEVGEIEGGTAFVDIADFVKPNELFYYVKLDDLVTYSEWPGADVDAIAAIGSALRLQLDSKVLFDTGKSELKPEGIEAVKELANSIKILKEGKLIVEGHTDNVGSATTNQKLSVARAKSVSAELQKHLPKAFNFQEVGYGESRPIVENDSPENRAKNRRVEILVIPN